MEDEMNKVLIAVQKYREWVAAKRDEVTHIWKNPPPPMMLAYGAVVLTSGILLSALGQWSNLGGFIWGAELLSVLKLGFKDGELKLVGEGEGRSGEWIAGMCKELTLTPEGSDEMNRLFLELLQWNMVESVNTQLDDSHRLQLAEVLKAGGSDQDRSEAIKQFLHSVRVDAFAAREHLIKSITRSIQETGG